MTDWNDFVSWILGEEVRLSQIQAPDRSVSFTPTWTAVLEFEYLARQEICRRINVLGSTMTQALLDVRGDTAFSNGTS